jgi:hypothetical protein
MLNVVMLNVTAPSFLGVNVEKPFLLLKYTFEKCVFLSLTFSSLSYIR